MFNDVAQRMDDSVLGVGTNLQQHIAMAQRRIQRIIRETGHFLQLFRHLRFQAIAFIKQRGAD